MDTKAELRQNARDAAKEEAAKRLEAVAAATNQATQLFAQVVSQAVNAFGNGPVLSALMYHLAVMQVGLGINRKHVEAAFGQMSKACARERDAAKGTEAKEPSRIITPAKSNLIIPGR